MGKRTGGRKKVTLAPVSPVPTLAIETGLDERVAPTPERLLKVPGVTITTGVNSRRLEAIFTTPERPVTVGQDGVTRIADATLDRLFARQRLDEGDRERNTRLFEAGEKLRRHWYHGGEGMELGSVDLNRAGGGSNGGPAWAMPTSESAAYHRGQMRRARLALDAATWSTTFAIVCGEDTLDGAGRQAGFAHPNAASAVAIDRLRRGLAELAQLWGILPPPQPANDGPIALKTAV